MAKTGQLIVDVKISWWLRYYLIGVSMMCYLTGAQPDYDKIDYWISRAVKIKALN